MTELATLFKGRGINRAGVRSWLGPALAAALAVPDGLTDEQARAFVREGLAEAASRLPADLGDVVQAAAGLTSDERLLEARLADIGERQGRGVRTMRRRLDDAKLLLAAQLTEPSPTADPDGAPTRNWMFEECALTLRVDGDLARMEIGRTIRALRDGFDTVTEMLFTTTTHGPGTTLAVEALEGCEFLGLKANGPGSRSMEFRLPRTLVTGERHAYRLATSVHPVGRLRPLLAMMPLRPCRQFTATLVLGGDRPITRAAVVDGGPALGSPDDLPPAGVPMVLPDSARVVTHTFTDLVPGRTYGLVWEWGDGVSDPRPDGD